MELYKIILAERKRQRITQEKLAEEVGINKSTLSSFENGKRTVNSFTVQKLLTALRFRTISQGDAVARSNELISKENDILEKLEAEINQLPNKAEILTMIKELIVGMEELIKLKVR